MTNWKEEAKKIEQCPQRQDSTFEQLVDLYSVATKLGFYDAGDVIRTIIEKEEQKHKHANVLQLKTDDVVKLAQSKLPSIKKRMKNPTVVYIPVVIDCDESCTVNSIVTPELSELFGQKLEK